MSNENTLVNDNTITVNQLFEMIVSSQACSSLSSLFILDCRSSADFDHSHIIGSHHVQVPCLLYKRLLKGTLHPTSVLFDGELAGNDFARRYKTARIILIVKSTDHNDHYRFVEDHQVSSCQDKSIIDHDTSVASLLYKKLRQDGCDVKFMSGKK